MNCPMSWCKLDIAPVVLIAKCCFYNCWHKRFCSLHKVLVHKQRMSSRSIGHSYHRSTSNCFSPWIVLCRIFQLHKKMSQINPPVFSTWQCYEKCGGRHDPLQHDALSNAGDLRFYFSSSYHCLLYSLRSSLASVYKVYFLLKLFFQFLNSWWVSTNEAIRFEEENALTVLCVSLDGILQK